jgi:hypothetical protein
MYVSTLSAIAILEISLLAIASSIGLFIFYRKQQKKWKLSVLKIQRKINKIKRLSDKYSIVKRHLYELAKEKQQVHKELLAFKAQDKNIPVELQENITTLNRQLKKKSFELETTQQELNEKLVLLDTLMKQDSNKFDDKSSENENKNEHTEATIVASESHQEDLTPVEQTETQVSDEEVQRLRLINDEQKKKIVDLKKALRSVNDHSDTPQEVPKLKQLLKESETCIGMLEQELSNAAISLNRQTKDLDSLKQTNKSLVKELKAKPSSSAARLVENNGRSSPMLDSPNEISSQDNRTPVAAKSSSDDQSNIVVFARSAIACHSLKCLADSILKIVKIYELDAVIQLRSQTSIYFEASYKPIKNKSELIFNTNTKDERFIQSDPNLLINFPSIALLLENMPIDNQESYARFKETFSIIMELANDQMGSLEEANILKQQKSVLKKIINTTQSTIMQVEKKSKDHAEQSKSIIDCMTDVLGDKAFVSKVEPSLQPLFEGVVSETRTRFDRLHADVKAVDQSFSKIINELSKKI